MSEPVVFPNAPIMEAVLDLRVDPQPSLDLATLESIHEAIRDQFPDKQRLTGFEAGFEFHRGDARAAAQASARPIGFLFRSADQTEVVQVTQTGFTFNKLKPYANWASFRDEARQIWSLYKGITLPARVTRVALRYINRIEIPLPFDDFKDYILTVPEVAPGISQSLAHFFLRLEIPYPDLPATAVAVLTMDPSAPMIDRVPLIFDIDVFRMDSFEPASEEIWVTLEALRKLKNTIFSSSLTEKAMELFR